MTSHWQDHCRRLSSVIRGSHHRRSHRRARDLRPTVMIDVVRCHRLILVVLYSEPVLLHLQLVRWVNARVRGGDHCFASVQSDADMVGSGIKRVE